MPCSPDISSVVLSISSGRIWSTHVYVVLTVDTHTHPYKPHIPRLTALSYMTIIIRSTHIIACIDLVSPLLCPQLRCPSWLWPHVLTHLPYWPVPAVSSASVAHVPLWQTQSDHALQCSDTQVCYKHGVWHLLSLLLFCLPSFACTSLVCKAGRSA